MLPTSSTTDDFQSRLRRPTSNHKEKARQTMNVLFGGNAAEDYRKRPGDNSQCRQRIHPVRGAAPIKPWRCVGRRHRLQGAVDSCQRSFQAAGGPPNLTNPAWGYCARAGCCTHPLFLPTNRSPQGDKLNRFNEKRWAVKSTIICSGRMTDLRHHRRSSALGLRLIALLVRPVIFTCWLVTARRLPKPMS